MSTEVATVQSLFHILNKDMVKVPFIFSPAQLALDEIDNPFGRARIIIAKARQKGFSRGILAKFTIRCMGREGTRAVVISHESDSTQRLLDSVGYYIKYMNGPTPTLGLNSRKEMTFPKRDSVFYIGTAGSRSFGRGDTISDLHCSEYAFWENTEKMTVGLFQAVPYSGRIYIESTGNGRNNDFYYTWQNAEVMGFTKLFFPWFADDEYELAIDKEWQPDTPKHNAYLKDLQAKYNLSGRKMAWYEWKLRELRENLIMMQQEYPSDPEECFQATGGTIFNNVHPTASEQWVSENYEGYYIYKLAGHPQPNLTYVMGVDPSGGTGNDDAALQIFCAETAEQVFELADNHINPIRIGELAVQLGKAYNEAFITCESNNHGAAVIPYLKRNYLRNKLYKRKLETLSTPATYGWNNSDNTKHALVGIMQEDLGDIYLHGFRTTTELKNFEENERGKMSGKSDNLVIATGLAMLGLRKFHYLRQAWLKPKEPEVKIAKPNYMVYTFEEVYKNIANRRQAIRQYGRQAANW